MIRRLCLPFLALLLVTLVPCRSGAADREAGRTAADLLPATTVMYAEMPQLTVVLDLILDHPLRARLESLDPYQKALELPGYLRFKAAVSVFEAELGQSWRKIVGTLGEGGVYAGFDAASQGAAILVQAKDEASLAKIRDKVLQMARAEAQRQGQDDPVKSGMYRDVTAYRLGDARFVTLGRWLMLTNKSELGKKLIDTYLDGDSDALSDNEQFQTARASRDSQAAGWVYVDIKTIRAATQNENGENDALRGPRDNPVAELLLGGIFTALRETPYATLSLFLDAGQVRVVAETPFQPQWIEESREYFFGAKGMGTAPPLLAVKRPLLSVTAYRDVSQMWLRAGDLFDDRVNDGLAQADSNLSTLFSGKDFGEDILGSFKPEVQLVAARQDFADRKTQPAIKLPSFALVAQLKDAETMRPQLRRIFMSLVGFLNVVGAMNGQPQLDFDMQKDDTGQLITAEYVVDEKDKDNTEAAINYNFSPSIAFRDSMVVIASTRELAREILAVTSTSPKADGDPKTNGAADAMRPNTVATVDLSELRDILKDNLNQLVAQSMLEKGNTREEAQGEVGLLLELAGLLKSGDLRLATGNGLLVVEVKLTLAESKPAK